MQLRPAPADQDRHSLWLTLAAHPHRYALPLYAVVEVTRMVAITPLPESEPWLAGVINRRGQVTPIVELRVRLGLEHRPFTLDTPLVICTHDAHTIALLVDEVHEVIALPSVPARQAGTARLVAGTVQHGEQLLLLLDPAILHQDVRRTQS